MGHSLSELACCVKVIDVGTQNFKAPSGATPKREIVLAWELMFASEHHKRLLQIVYKSYELNLTKGSTLRQDLQSWLGDELKEDSIKRFAPKSLLSKYCILKLDSYIGVDGKKNHSAQKITPLPKEFDLSKLVKPVTQFGIFMVSEPDMNLLESLPPEIQNKIKNSPEYIWSQKH